MSKNGHFLRVFVSLANIFFPKRVVFTNCFILKGIVFLEHYLSRRAVFVLCCFFLFLSMEESLNAHCCQETTLELLWTIEQWAKTREQDCIPVGCIPPTRWPCLLVCLWGGAWPWGLPAWSWGGGVPAWSGRGCLPGPGGGVVSQHAMRQTPPCEQNHWRLWTYYLAPTSLRAVKIKQHYFHAHWRKLSVWSVFMFIVCIR